MDRLRGGIRTGSWSAWIVHVLLLAFALRALVPAGYMPDFGALSKGVYKVVICTSAGSKSITVDADGHSVPDNSGAHGDQPCAFSGLAAKALPNPQSIAIALPLLREADQFEVLSVVLPPARAGPVLGSRGPPLNS